MTSWGYTLSSEEHPPADLVRHAVMAEDVGFDFLSISDHFHPWVDAQGHSPFVWSVLGAVSQATRRGRVGTGVTSLRSFEQAGLDHIHLHQIGPDQAGFLRFWERELRPKL